MRRRPGDDLVAIGGVVVWPGELWLARVLFGVFSCCCRCDVGGGACALMLRDRDAG